MHIHRQSAYLIGRDSKIADIPVLHPSCSKQHAVLQYRLTPVDLPDGTVIKKTRPYIIDLNSANGTYLNDERIEPQRSGLKYMLIKFFQKYQWLLKLLEGFWWLAY